MDITLAELALESFFPADAETAAALCSNAPLPRFGAGEGGARGEARGG